VQYWLRQRRGVTKYSADKLLQVFAFALHMNFNQAEAISNPACQLVLPGQPIDKRPEANALHLA
jgi:hypothetical protein